MADGVSVGVEVRVLVGVRVDVEVCVAVADGVTVKVAVGENVAVGVDVAVAVGSGLSVNAVPSPPVLGIRSSDLESSGFNAPHMRFVMLKAPMAVANSIAQIK